MPERRSDKDFRRSRAFSQTAYSAAEQKSVSVSATAWLQNPFIHFYLTSVSSTSTTDPIDILVFSVVFLFL